jgi:hypothetical protein
VEFIFAISSCFDLSEMDKKSRRTVTDTDRKEVSTFCFSVELVQFLLLQKRGKEPVNEEDGDEMEEGEGEGASTQMKKENKKKDTHGKQVTIFCFSVEVDP